MLYRSEEWVGFLYVEIEEIYYVMQFYELLIIYSVKTYSIPYKGSTKERIWKDREITVVKYQLDFA